MKQTKAMSLIESAINIGVGFGISLVAQIVFLPLLGVAISLSQNFQFAVIMTVISLARQFLLRRLFEALHIRVPLSPSILAIAAERRRQIDVEGWTADHDDEHHAGEMAAAGACYALTVGERSLINSNFDMSVTPATWPWPKDWWKPQDNRRDLVRSGALIVAELDRLERMRRRRVKALS